MTLKRVDITGDSIHRCEAASAGQARSISSSLRSKGWSLQRLALAAGDWFRRELGRW